MQVENCYVLFESDFQQPPSTIKFNTSIMREVLIPLGKDDTLRVYCDAASVERFMITVKVVDCVAPENF